MEKYYTPDIEEFHVGFEYFAKIPNKEKFSKEIYHFNDSHKELVNRVTLHEGDVKVKYLDHSDITSLGFKYVYGLKTKSDTPIDVNYGASVFKAKDKFAFGGTEYTIYYFKEDPTRIEISVNRYGHYLEDQNTLPFTVKNKFELKKLLKQLRYE